MTITTATPSPQPEDDLQPGYSSQPTVFQRAELAALANRQRLLNREARARTIAKGVKLNTLS
jgi:hypothetical protein